MKLPKAIPNDAHLFQNPTVFKKLPEVPLCPKCDDRRTEQSRQKFGHLVVSGWIFSVLKTSPKLLIFQNHKIWNIWEVNGWIWRVLKTCISVNSQLIMRLRRPDTEKQTRNHGNPLDFGILTIWGGNGNLEFFKTPGFFKTRKIQSLMPPNAPNLVILKNSREMSYILVR